MTAEPATALVMRSDASACHDTATNLRRLGFSVSELGDAPHLYAEAIRFAIAHAADRRPLVILTEPTADAVRDLEMLRTFAWRIPLVLVGPDARPETGRRLRAACLSAERPSAGRLRRAIATARTASEAA